MNFWWKCFAEYARPVFALYASRRVVSSTGDVRADSDELRDVAADHRPSQQLEFSEHTKPECAEHSTLHERPTLHAGIPFFTASSTLSAKTSISSSVV
jgi:hypothetical protein